MKKVTVINGVGEEYDDYRSRLRIVGMSDTLDFLEGEPEDANLSRDYRDCYKIKNLIKEANELGLKGEEINIVEIEDNNIFSDNYNKKIKIKY